MRIAGIQISAGSDLERNMQRAVEMAKVAADKDARIICYPELFLTPWFPRCEERSLRSWALDVESGHLELFRRLSESTNTVLLVPFFEHAKDNYYNSTAIFDAGKTVGTYRKIHVPNLPLYREQYYFSSGDSGFPVFATSQGKIGVQICWDNFFPEGSRILALKGAKIIFSPTAASLNTHILWERAITANAFANNLFIFRVNRVGQEEGISFYGRSFCADPWGEMVSELAGGKEAIVIADINLAESTAASETWGFLKQRKPGEYGELVK
ncbi:MAG TPA: nitrilase-related carbon-nitrogen hydrolase [Nitrospirota bacterium]|nr:nitrilase-related carbon-nitrogen hydrolase [Nitrospirota bacterium]